MASVTKNDGGADARHHAQKWHIGMKNARRGEEAIEIDVLEFLEICQVLLLAREGLDDTHARNVFGKRSGQSRRLLAHAAIGAHAKFMEEVCGDGDWRQNDTHCQAEAPIIL